MQCNGQIVAPPLDQQTQSWPGQPAKQVQLVLTFAKWLDMAGSASKTGLIEMTLGKFQWNTHLEINNKEQTR